MHIGRRALLMAAAAAAVNRFARGRGSPGQGSRMYGLIGKMIAAAGQRDRLIDILLAGTGEMPGCLAYVIAKDPADDNAIWITEVWDTEASHKASLSLPAVQAAIARGKPLIAGFGERFVTAPVGGHGLKTPG
jgi:quinol monooxygenase YgiN